MIEWLQAMNLKEVAKKVEDIVEQTLIYCDSPYGDWTRIRRTNNVIARLNREIRLRTRGVGCFPDGNFALPVCARLRHVTGSQLSNKKYRSMQHLKAAFGDASVAD